MARLTDFGATLQPLMRQVWQGRVSMFRTRNLSVLDAFNEVYRLYSKAEAPDDNSDGDLTEFEQLLASYAEETGFTLSAQGDFLFVHRDKVKTTHRIYLNTRSLDDRGSVAYVLMQTIKEHFARNACEFKVLKLNDNRSDNLVVYVEDASFKAVRDRLLKLDWSDCLRTAVPAGTKQLRPGMGWAEEPGVTSPTHRKRVNLLTKQVSPTLSGASFGAVVSACVVLGLKAAQPTEGEWDTDANLTDFCDGVAARLNALGVDPLKPHKAIRFDKELLAARYREKNKDDEEMKPFLDKGTAEELFEDAVKLHFKEKIPK